MKYEAAVSGDCSLRKIYLEENKFYAPLGHVKEDVLHSAWAFSTLLSANGQLTTLVSTCLLSESVVDELITNKKPQLTSLLL